MDKCNSFAGNWRSCHRFLIKFVMIAGISYDRDPGIFDETIRAYQCRLGTIFGKFSVSQCF